MKKVLFGLGSICLAAILLAGCRKTGDGQMESGKTADTETSSKEVNDAGERQQTTKLVWQSSQFFAEHEKYFNHMLSEQGIPIEVEFIEADMAAEGQAVDLKELSWTWQDTYDFTEEISAGRFLALDEYLESEEGSVIKDSLPEHVWDTYKVDGTQYTVLSVGFIPTKIVYIWDTELAKKYDVHPEEWNGNIWEYKDELLKVCEGEQEKGSFVTVEGARYYSQYLEGMTQILGVCYPFVIRETDEAPQAELLYETSEYREYLAGMQSLFENGIYDPDTEENLDLDVTSFLKIETDFKTKDAYLAWQPEEFWDTHEVKEIWRQPLWRLSICAQETGITAESGHPDEAFSLLCSLYEDADLINALMWGEEGTDYELCGNTAEKPVTGGYIPARYVGNNFLAYAEVGQDPNKKELYPKWLEECEKSKINGFAFSGRACEEELQKAYRLYEKWTSAGGEQVLAEHEARIQEYRDAGADRIIEEWNRQYREWRENGTKD